MANILKPKRTSTAAKVPTTTDLASGELGVNMTDQKVYINNGTAVVQVGAGKLAALQDVPAPTTSSTYLQWNGSAYVWATVSGGGGSTSPAGANTEIQYNNAGAFGASSTFTYDGTTLKSPNVEATGGVLADGIFGGTYVDGIAIDYDTVDASGRISVGGADSLKFYNGGVAGSLLGSINNNGDWSISRFLDVGNGTLIGGATNPIFAAAGSANQYIQAYVHNDLAGTSASSDIACYPNNGTDASGWIDMGITSSVYSDTAYTTTGANEGYILMSAPSSSGTTGNLVYATDSTGSENAHQWYVGGFGAAKTAYKMQLNATNLLVKQPIQATGIIESTTGGFKFPDGTTQTTAATGGSGSPGGSTTQLQYNNAGAFAGISTLTYNGTTVSSSADMSIHGLTVGLGAGSITTNVALGASALVANTTGSSNLAIGDLALSTNTTGALNVALGAGALKLSNGSNNVAVGSSTLQANTSGSTNIAIGSAALFSNNTGSGNIGIGTNAQLATTSGLDNVAVGTNALNSNIGGSGNLALGAYAGQYAVGSNAFYLDNQDRINNAGEQTGSLLYGTFSATPASQTLTTNSAFTATYGVTAPSYALNGGGLISGLVFLSAGNVNDSDSIALGGQALFTTSGLSVRNIGIGSLALANITGASVDNIALGYTSTIAAVSGSNNVGIGSRSFLTLNTGSTNTGVGSSVFRNLVTGSGNVGLGYYAGAYETTSNNFYVDNQDRVNTAGDKAGALLYGTFSATPLNQTLKINAQTTLSTTLNLAAGTTTRAPLSFGATGATLTTAAAGAVEFDGTAFYNSMAASTRGVMPSEQMVILTGTNTLTSQTAVQPIFDGGGGPTNGAVTLPIGTYQFECVFALTGMSATSGSFGFGLGGTATKTFAFHASASKGTTTTLTTSSALTGTYNTAANTTLNTASTGTAGTAVIKGIIRVTVAGTVIPQVSLTVASAAVIQANSYFKISPVGNATVATVGNWS